MLQRLTSAAGIKNGNAPTLDAFQKLSSGEQEIILNFLKTRPPHLQVEVNGRHVYLVHGFPAENVHDEVWNRPTLNTPNPIPDCQLIIGHTPVFELIEPEEAKYEYVAELESREDHLQICHAPGFLDIDCCCGYDVPIKAMACMRLEDMKEFYQQ